MNYKQPLQKPCRCCSKSPQFIPQKAGGDLGVYLQVNLEPYFQYFK